MNSDYSPTDCQQNETFQFRVHCKIESNTEIKFIADQNTTELSREHRVTWSNWMEYFLSMVGCCVGLGNFWRFPYICIRNGGGAFLIPYLFFLLSCGIPLFFIEVAMGQFMSRGAYHIWSMCPLFKGIGLGECIFTALSSPSYLMVISWIIIYLYHSFRSPLPWTLCGQSWNTPGCVPPGVRTHRNVSQDSWNSSSDEGPTMTGHSDLNEWVNRTNLSLLQRTPGQEFWLNNVLELSNGLEALNGLPWHTTLALFISCLVVFLCMVRGIKSTGKVVYVTATFPYLLLIVLIIKGLTLPGAMDGVMFYVKPDFSKLILAQTWLEASIQVFFSICIICGLHATLSSYNKFQNNCVRDAVAICLLSEGTSFLAGFAIFTFLGHMAYNLKVPLESFSASGSGLAFIVYPEAVSYLPLPQLWAVLFFLMLLTVALDSAFCMIEVIFTAFHDLCPRLMKKWAILVKFGFISILFLFGLLLASRGGFYLLQLIDWYLPSIGIYVVGVLECIVVSWIYGADKFMDDIQLMIGRKPPFICIILWKYVTPVLLLILLMAFVVSYTVPVVEGYRYSDGAMVCGWLLAMSWILPVPAVAIGQLIVARGGFLKRLKTTCRPSIDWQPGDVNFREEDTPTRCMPAKD